MVIDISKITLENINDYYSVKGKPKSMLRKEYNNWYYLTKTKEKRKQKRLLEKSSEKVEWSDK